MRSVFLFTLMVINSFNLQASEQTQELPEKVKNLHRALANDSCSTKSDFFETASYSLSSTVKLYIIPCTLGAHHTTSYAYTLNSDNEVSPIVVLQFDEIKQGVSGTYHLTGASYNHEQRTLTTFAEARELGDCGQSSTSKIILDSEFDFVRIKTVEIRSKHVCDGHQNRWPIVFSQK